MAGDAQGQIADDSGADIAGPTFKTVNYVDIETASLPNAVSAVPTLGEWGIILLSILLLTMGLHHIVLIPAPMIASSAVANTALPRTANGWIYSSCEFRAALKALVGLAILGYACSLLLTGTITTADAIGGLLTVPFAAYLAHAVMLLRKQETSLHF
jgi:hypothetical protein